MNIINLVKITPLLMSSLIGINKANSKYSIFAFSITKTTTSSAITYKINSSYGDFSRNIDKITFSNLENNQLLCTINDTNYNKQQTIDGNQRMRVDIIFYENTDLNKITFTLNNENTNKTIDNNKNSVYSQLWPSMLKENQENIFAIYEETTPEPEPPENQYKEYTTYELNQSKLKAINVPYQFSSHKNDNYNYIEFENTNFTINIHKNQKATIYYTDKYITLPILGTFFNNNIQYNILDFYILDNNNIINLLETITNNKIVSSARRTNINDIYSGNCNSLNALFDNNTYADNYTYTYENNTIKINEGTPIGNASIIANDKQVDPYATSLFGINPLTKSYFGLNNRLYITQNVQSSIISSFTSQYEFWNYTEYMPIFSFTDTDTSKWNKTITTTMNINLYNYDIYLIAFPTDTNNDVSLNVNDITTIIGAMDNLENIGLLPFTFGSIILIGLMLGFIMILIKILK